jgi:hypothetical protein
MIDQPQNALNFLNKRSWIIYRSFSLMAAVLLWCSLFIGVENGPASLQNDGNHFKSGQPSDLQISGNITQSNLLELVKPKKTQSVNTLVLSNYLKLTNHLQPQPIHSFPGYTCKDIDDPQLICLRLDIPPPSLL